MSVRQGLQCVFMIAALVSLLATGSADAQSLVCSVTPQWKVTSVTQTSSDGELLLAVETTNARGAVHQITLPMVPGSTRHVTQTGRAGWTFAVHVQEDERPRTVKVSTQALCDGRMRGYDEAVLSVVVALDRT